MLMTFTTDVYADITMLGDDALAILKKMGDSATVVRRYSASGCSSSTESVNSRFKCTKRSLTSS
ncbi:DUF1840 family protein [Nitrosomonas communis]|uniref:DUF1840 family protein n=1 Tax=Nitrosomonas communis TaxID=44574 RepID=UPI003D2CD2A0